MSPSGFDSPFHASGLVYEGARAFYSKRIPGGNEAFVASLSAPLAAFWNQIFIAAGRYDALPLIDLSAHAAQLCGLSHSALVIENARWLAERDINGVYRLLLKVMSPAAVAERLPKAAMRYFDFGEASSELAAPMVCLSKQTGIPAIMVDWFVAASAGFCDVALRVAGAKEVHVRELARTVDGLRSGVATSTLTMQIAWKR